MHWRELSKRNPEISACFLTKISCNEINKTCSDEATCRASRGVLCDRGSSDTISGLLLLYPLIIVRGLAIFPATHLEFLSNAIRIILHSRDYMNYRQHIPTFSCLPMAHTVSRAHRVNSLESFIGAVSILKLCDRS